MEILLFSGDKENKFQSFQVSFTQNLEQSLKIFVPSKLTF